MVTSSDQKPLTTKRSRAGRWRLRTAMATALAGLGVIASGTAQAATVTQVASEPPTRLVQSTGNLYWTSSAINEFGPSFAGVYRTGKTDTPGKETLLYSENRDDYFFFGDLAYAQVNGAFFGYFTANYVDAGTAQIKRVPLTGGPAVVLATLPRAFGVQDLVTDGTFLYWADGLGVRKMSLSGGTVTTLATGTSTFRVGLDATQVFYSDGNRINSVPKTGGAVTAQVIDASPITAMFVQAGAGGTSLYWGNDSGSVQSRPVGGAVTVYQSVTSTRSVSAVSFDGTRVLWSDFVRTAGNNYVVRKSQGGTTTVVSSGGVGATDVQGDAGAMFWGDVSGVKKSVH